jgi:hypothetical protein
LAQKSGSNPKTWQQFQWDFVAAQIPFYSKEHHGIRPIGKKQTFKREGPIRVAALKSHLSGGAALSGFPGVCDKARILVFDLDWHGESSPPPEWKVRFQHLSRLLAKLNEDKVYYYVQTSAGGNGFHIHVLFKDWIAAKSVKDYGESVVERAGYTSGTLGVDFGQIEVFPKQEDVTGAYGNSIRLPFGGLAAPVCVNSLRVLSRTGWIPPAIETLLNDAPPLVIRRQPKVRRRAKRRGVTREEIEGYLKYINPVGYDSWINVGMAIHHELGDEGRDLWEAWSQSDDGDPTREPNFQSHWVSFGRKRTGRLFGIGSLRLWAREGGGEWTCGVRAGHRAIDPSKYGALFFGQQI